MAHVKSLMSLGANNLVLHMHAYAFVVRHPKSGADRQTEEKAPRGKRKRADMRRVSLDSRTKSKQGKKK